MDQSDKSHLSQIFIQMCWEMAENIQPEITCPMTYNWFPFDTQHCYLVMSVTPYKIKLYSPRIEQLLMMYQQNIVLDYKVEIYDLPDDKKTVAISQVSGADPL